MLQIKKVSSNFSLVAGGEYNIKHWPGVNYLGINIQKGIIAFFNVSGGTIEDDWKSKSGWCYHQLSDGDGLKIIQLFPLRWEYIAWGHKELSHGVPALKPKPGPDKMGPQYRW